MEDIPGDFFTLIYFVPENQELFRVTVNGYNIKFTWNFKEVTSSRFIVIFPPITNKTEQIDLFNIKNLVYKHKNVLPFKLQPVIPSICNVYYLKVREATTIIVNNML